MTTSQTVEVAEVLTGQYARYLRPLTARGIHEARSRAIRITSIEFAPSQQVSAVVANVKSAHLGEYRITLLNPRVVESSAYETPPFAPDEFTLWVLENGTWDVEFTNPVRVKTTQRGISITSWVILTASSLQIHIVNRDVTTGVCKDVLAPIS